MFNKFKVKLIYNKYILVMKKFIYKLDNGDINSLSKLNISNHRSAEISFTLESQLFRRFITCVALFSVHGETSPCWTQNLHFPLTSSSLSIYGRHV